MPSLAFSHVVICIKVGQKDKMYTFVFFTKFFVRLFAYFDDTFKVFEEWLLDADWSLNAANWQWLSASAFFHQYFRVYSPIAFGKKTDKNGDYIRKYLPVLKNMPAQYIYEPWMAPPSVQKIAKCIIGQD